MNVAFWENLALSLFSLYASSATGGAKLFAQKALTIATAVEAATPAVTKDVAPIIAAVNAP